MAIIRLRTLGGLDLRSSDGRDLGAVLAQPKRCALLAYLAIATPDGFSRRDTVVALFWPGLDSTHARAALRQALYFLRRELGDEAIIARGEDEVGVDGGVIRCDAVEFARALARADPAAALAEYAGDLLDGFFVTDAAPELDDWIARERRALKAQAAGAAWRCSEDCERDGDGRAATHWARLAALLQPDDEVGVRRLISLLERQGDRAGALRAYDDFSARLMREFDIRPSRATVRLMDDMRRCETPAGKRSTLTSRLELPVASGQSAAETRIAADGVSDGTHRDGAAIGLLAKGGLPRRRWSAFIAASVVLLGVALAARMQADTRATPQRVVVGAFVNRTGDRRLDPIGEIVADWVTSGLQQTGLLAVVPTMTAFAVAPPARQRGRTTTEERRLAHATDAQLVVAGSYFLLHDTLRFTYRIVEGESGRVLGGGVGIDAGLSDPLAGAELLRQRVMANLAELADPRLRAWAALSGQPPSFAAYLEFTQGLDLMLLGGDSRRALPHFVRSAAVDSMYAAPRLWAIDA
ncbi:MAG: hypothetical protein M3068_13395, partial [Gemmatimonadota bacterium]|nr:hypothetical protein [Gemmatimonadota bacterium]